MFVTLLLVVFIGEAVREAFDPKEYSRPAMTTRRCLRRSHCCRSADCGRYFYTEAGVAKAVDGVDLDIRPGEVLGLVGESGIGQERHRAEHPAADPRSARARSSPARSVSRDATC